MRKHKQNWLDIFSGFRVALDARKIVLGTLGMYVTVIVLLGMLSLASRWWPGAKTLVGDLLQKPSQAISKSISPQPEPVPGQPQAEPQPQPPRRLKALGFFAAGGILMLFIWSFFGGAISRIAAVDFAKDQRIPIGEATEFAAKKFGSFFWAPLVPLIFFIIFLLCNALLGLVGRISGVGPIVVGLLFGLATLSAFLALLLAIGGLFGFIFMWPTIAMEGTDAFDAISRAFNYLYARPWKTFWCWFMASVYGLAVSAFVVLFTQAMLKIALKSVAFGMGRDFMRIELFLKDGYVTSGSDWPTIVAMILIRVVLIMAWGLVLGFFASYKISSMTIIYSVLRRDVDGTDMAEVFMPEPAPEPAPVPPAEPKAESKPEAAPEQQKTA